MSREEGEVMTKSEALELVKSLMEKDRRDHPQSTLAERMIRVLAAALVHPR